MLLAEQSGKLCQVGAPCLPRHGPGQKWGHGTQWLARASPQTSKTARLGSRSRTQHESHSGREPEVVRAAVALAHTGLEPQKDGERLRGEEWGVSLLIMPAALPSHLPHSTLLYLVNSMFAGKPTTRLPPQPSPPQPSGPEPCRHLGAVPITPATTLPSPWSSQKFLVTSL